MVGTGKYAENSVVISEEDIVPSNSARIMKSWNKIFKGLSQRILCLKHFKVSEILMATCQLRKFYLYYHEY